jgi:hypothetical protein
MRKSREHTLANSVTSVSAKFGLMVTATGARSFVFQYRNAQQISRRWTWSTDLPLLKARREAKKMAGRVAEGKDPVAERSKEREAAREAISNTLEGRHFSWSRLPKTIPTRLLPDN